MSNSDTAGAEAAPPPADGGSTDQADVDGTGATTTFLWLADDDTDAGLAVTAVAAAAAHASATSSRRRTIYITTFTNKWLFQFLANCLSSNTIILTLNLYNARLWAHQACWVC